MSAPIRVCTVYRAAKGNEKSYQFLVDAMAQNLKAHAFTMYPCEHKPPCSPATDAQIKALDLRLGQALLEMRGWKPEEIRRGKMGNTG